jgi:hypothetical protein
MAVLPLMAVVAAALAGQRQQFRPTETVAVAGRFAIERSPRMALITVRPGLDMPAEVVQAGMRAPPQPQTAGMEEYPEVAAEAEAPRSMAKHPERAVPGPEAKSGSLLMATR